MSQLADALALQAAIDGLKAAKARYAAARERYEAYAPAKVGELMKDDAGRWMSVESVELEHQDGLLWWFIRGQRCAATGKPYRHRKAKTLVVMKCYKP